eukprot:TRINITY_DN101570_c0_g1_i1.p1 TRINITY_DN101570_c0_g1~~TRINITY_DN101570_c0_g1_i1.p1  ORF type:complete len:188 (-),score=34.54 TRINITY_DN101570_c0_g1_i1:218-781(-)
MEHPRADHEQWQSADLSFAEKDGEADYADWCQAFREAKQIQDKWTPANYEDKDFLEKWQRVLEISKVKGSEVSPKTNDEARKIRAKGKADGIVNTAQQVFNLWLEAGAEHENGANGFWHGTDETGSKPTGFIGLQDSFVEEVLQEMLQAGKRPGWSWHNSTSTGTADGRAIHRATPDGTRTFIYHVK